MAQVVRPLTSYKTFNIYKGVAEVTSYGPGVPWTVSFKYGPIKVPSGTQIISANLKYSVQPDNLPVSSGFVVNVNGVKVAEEEWDIFTGNNLRTKSVPVNLSPGDNYIELTWSIVTFFPGWTTRFDTTVTLDVEYSGESPSTQTEEWVKYITYGFVIVGAVAVIAAIAKFRRR